MRKIFLFYVFVMGFTGPFFPVKIGFPADTPDAQNAYQEAIRLKEAGSYREAEGQFKVALGLDPSNADYHFELANLYALRYDLSQKASKNSPEAGLLGNAAGELEQTLMLRPDFLAARYNLGVVYKRQKRFEKAREEFRKVLDLDPNQANAVMQIGSTYEEQGFFDEAKSFYEKARGLNSGNLSSQDALEDLSRREEESRQRARADQASRFSDLGRGFGFTPFSQASGYEQDRQSAMNSTGGLQQALPYLGSWVINQFMKARNSDKE